MSSGKKSLTEPPTNLKEAIDWVIKIEEVDAIKGLAGTLKGMLSGEPGGVRDEVKEAFNEVSKGVIENFSKSKTQIHQTSERGFAVPHGILHKFSKGLDPFPSGSAARVNREKAERWVSKFQEDTLKTPITELANGFESFRSAIVQDSSSDSAYSQADAKWESLQASEHKDCAVIFLAIIPLLYIGLTYLYWRCSPDSDSPPSNISWYGQSLSESKGLKKYMEALGYADNLKRQKNGGQIVSNIMNSMFSSELEKAYGSSKTHYPEFLKALQDKALQSTLSTSSPLTSLYVLSYYFITYPLHDVRSTSPASPSFLGYSGPAALAGAHRLDPEVTGKDGGGGPGGTAALTNEVKKLLEPVKDVDPNLGVYIEKVTKALADGTPNGLIGKLAEGLQQFIGYDPSAGGSVFTGPNSKITGAGIAPSNLATYRLCDATIAFTIGVLEGCKSSKKANLRGDQKSKIDNVITKLHTKYGTGTQGLKEVGTQVKGKIGDNQLQGSNVKSFVNDLASAFETNLQSISSDNADTVADQVGKYLKGVFASKWQSASANDAATHLKSLVQRFTGTTPYNTNDGSFSSNIEQVKSALQPGSHATVQAILEAGKNAFMGVLKMPNYSATNYETNVQSASIKEVHAKIFLGCLPLYYQALTYIYWGCHENGGGWRNQTLANGSMRFYFDSQGLLPLYVDKSKRGAHNADSALKGFSEFKTAATSSLRNSNNPYVKFTEELQEKVKENSSNLSTDYPLSALFYGASYYFRYQQTTNAKSAVSAPKTIREMLYFLAALQFSSAYDDIAGHIGTLLPNDLSVADTSKPASGGNDTLSAADLNEYLRASCAFSSSVLGLIQGPGASEKSEPWLFELFCNSAFHFKYPSGTTLFSRISSYAYALQFQLLFLYSMCGNIGRKCGWQECTYGRDIKGLGHSLQSHICPGFKCQDATSCDHKSSQCKHNNYSDIAGCGKGSNPSPLQAFITGTLPSFGLSTSSTPNHMSDHPKGALCHTPMGFQASHLRSIGNGAVVYLVLKSICGNFSSPLRQLCEKLGCLTKRTPRSLGDLFGFTWHLKGQLAKTLGNITSATWFGDLKNKLPFSYQLKIENGQKLKTFVGTDHQAHGNSPADLTALHSSGCKEKEKTCGPYLSPLTLSNGATFGKPAPYASTYLSWMVYLTDDIETGFQELLDEFKNIDCSKTGCRKPASGTQACSKPHQPGTHGTSDECSCDSVVHCGGVLPLLYRYGFTFGSTGDLFGEVTNGTNTKRNCKAFVKQLQSDITGKPLQDLFESIDSFLYLFRFYFLYNLSSFWSIYICLILYTFFFLLDTLHLRSHLKLTSSHVVPPLNLLTSGTHLPITKLTYITQ
ncbi:variant erythrocyte surface antigen-1 family protein [Babesia caballi]|uniref:Variant erythrocyte surface antigen-1 family protein n=1 Tax=Babesia caballi TaxID=5871 RepID=A0AAV4LV17_BABCB|nr:variant erythrocyte surface antigen-1 family protein [Babesia caballi]